MAIRIGQRDDGGGKRWTSKNRLYLTADGKKAVKEGDPDANSLLVSEGGTIPEKQAEELGLTKQVQEPPANKAKQAPKNTK